jgi:malate permease and related proteins
MLNILLVFLYLIIGLSLQKVRQIPVRTPFFLNTYLIYLVLPAVAVLYLPAIEMTPELIFPAISVWLYFLAGWGLFSFIGKKLQWSKATIGCLILTAGLSNTSFLGYPIIEAIYGSEGLKIALLVDQPGSFLLVSSLAVVVAAMYGETKMRKRDISRKVLLFPPFLFFVLAMVMNILGWQIEGGFRSILEILAFTLTPLALISVGLQIRFKYGELADKSLWMGLGFSLILAPAIIYMLIGWFLDYEGLIFRVTVMEAAMPPMITASIIAVSYRLNPKLANLMVGVGIPVSFVTMAVWYWVLG